MDRRIHAFALATGVALSGFPVCSVSVKPAAAQTAPAAPRWEVFSSCAAAYRANWQNRLTDPSRTPSMAAMIDEEFEQYKHAAIGYYQQDQKASKDEADRRVDARVKASVETFVAMDKAGTLEAFIDKCPQVEE